MEKLAVVETHALELPGVVVEVTPVRQYLNGRDDRTDHRIHGRGQPGGTGS